MKAYNGYSGELRNEAQRWLNMMVATGEMHRPGRCCACGQTQGVIDMHAEDYSKPFAKGKTDKFPLCITCHLAVHCRFRNVSCWDRYREKVAAGYKLPPIFTRHFPLFMERFTCSASAFELLGQAAMGGGAPVPADYRPLDVIDGWLLSTTGRGWR